MSPTAQGVYRITAVLIEIEPPRTNAVTLTLPVLGEKPSAIVRRQARDSDRAGSSPP